MKSSVIQLTMLLLLGILLDPCHCAGTGAGSGKGNTLVATIDRLIGGLKGLPSLDNIPIFQKFNVKNVLSKTKHPASEKFNKLSLLEILSIFTPRMNSSQLADLRKTYPQKLPYHYMGLDLEKNPAWVVPYGRWDIESVTTVDMDGFDKYAEKILLDFGESVKTTNGTSFSLIFDYEGLPDSQLLNLPSTLGFIDMARRFHKVKNVKFCYGINLSPTTKALYSIARKVLKHKDLRTYGEPAKWKPELIKYYGADILPVKYGGVNSKIELSEVTGKKQ